MMVIGAYIFVKVILKKYLEIRSYGNYTRKTTGSCRIGKG